MPDMTRIYHVRFHKQKEKYQPAVRPKHDATKGVGRMIDSGPIGRLGYYFLCFNAITGEAKGGAARNTRRPPTGAQSVNALVHPFAERTWPGTGETLTARSLNVRSGTVTNRPSSMWKPSSSPDGIPVDI
jgi:hypothetical protein